jgi:Xaa-Pro aminopeptidase
VPDLLVVGDTVRTPELRHEVPLAVPDQFLFAEIDGARHVVATALELDRLSALDDVVAHPFEEYGYDTFISSGLPRDLTLREVFANACRALGIRAAWVPDGFPLAVAERLREAGVDVVADQGLFDDRRRVKNEAELAGIRRAQRAAEEGMRVCADVLGRTERSNGHLVLDGEPLTVERVKRDVEEAFLRNGSSADEFIVARGAQAAVGHDMGSGPIAPGESIVVDLWPRDRESACFADMTRTFVVGLVPDELREYHGHCKQALELCVEQIRPGLDGKELHRMVSDYFSEHGYPTQLTKPEGSVLQDGFYHATGHGVGLSVHEQPGIGRVGEPFVAGDVLAIEPGLYRNGFGGVRLEDLVLVTDDGCEVLTDFPYELDVR